MRAWHTTSVTEAGVGRKRGSITSFKTYSLKKAGEVMNKIRAAEEAAGLPKRKINPISLYLLEGSIQTFFGSRGNNTLVSIDIEERNE